MLSRPPSGEALALNYFRVQRRLTQAEAAALGGTTPRQLSSYERGVDPLSREKLEELVVPLGFSREAIDAFLFAHELIEGEPGEGTGSPVALREEEERAIERAAITAGWAVAHAVRAGLRRQRKEEKAEAARQEAREQWDRLKTASPETRRTLVAIFPEFRGWALAEMVCHESERAAARDIAEARELADFALFIAGKVPGDERFRWRLEGYCWGHVGNARRVGNDFDGGDEAFARAWELWRAGADSDGVLAEWRLLDLEASLRRAQRRFAESLEGLDKALAVCSGDAMATARILLKKEHVFDQMGDSQQALATLDEAAPWVEQAGDDSLLFAHRFNTLDNLCHQQRHEEASRRLPELRAFALEQRQVLHLIRVMWLEAKISIGQGRVEEAMALLEQVQRDFTARKLPYDAALSALDLALLWLEAGRAAEVQRLALGMAWIFDSKRIAREAVAALRLFDEAARQGKATARLVRHVIAEVEKGRRSTRPSQAE